MTVRKNESMEQEHPDTETAFTQETENPAMSSSKEDGLDLDELLSSMDQSQESDTPLYADGEPFASEICAPITDDGADKDSPAVDNAESEEPPVKSKRSGRKKKEEADTGLPTTPAADSAGNAADSENAMEYTEIEDEKTKSPAEESDTEHTAETDSPPANPQAGESRRPYRSSPVAEAPVLTIEARGEVETEQERDDIIWHEIHNAYRTRRILTGQLGGIEQTDSGKTIVIADYKGFRIVIPLKEMMIHVGRNPSGQAYADLMLRQNKILNNMLGAQIDFVVKGIDSKSRSVVASRMEAMLKKRQIFYMDTDSSGMYRIYEGRIVQARVIAVAEKVIRVEAFGVESSIMARDLAWDWIGDAHERFSVGDEILIRVLSVHRDSLEEISIRADLKSVSQNPNHENLKKCRIQSKYAGKVTDIHKGVVYVRLTNGVNAVAHSCYDQRMPGKKDDVSFAVTRIDEERGVAVGIITRIIRQNL